MTSKSDTSMTEKHAPEVVRPWRNRRVIVTTILGLVAAGVAIWYFGFNQRESATGSRNSRDKDSRNAIPVVAVPVQQGTLDVYIFALGTVTPVNSAVVRPRIDGQILSIAFEEGQMVRAGDLLAQIDPRPFEMQLALASGQLGRAQALLENAQVDLERYRTLLAQDSISSQQVDTQESLVRQQKAALQAEQSSVENAKLQLAHTRVISPIGGRIGLRQVNAGNLVRVSDTNGIAVVTQLRPVSVVFPIPEDSLPRVMKRLRSGDRIPVDAFDRNMKEKLGKGRLLTVDNQIDAATGTIKLKAEFPNADDALFANQFVNVRMPVETRLNATLAPTAAIQHGAAGPFVYVVRDDQTVTMAPVKIGPVQGEITVIDSGINVGSSVIVDGADRLREGIRVNLIEPNKELKRGSETRHTQVGGGG